MIHYSDLIDLGFQRVDFEEQEADTLYEDYHGHGYFYLTYPLHLDFQLIWEPHEGCQLVNLKTTKSIPIKNLPGVKDAIYLFTDDL